MEAQEGVLEAVEIHKSTTTCNIYFSPKCNLWASPLNSNPVSSLWNCG